MDYDIYDRHITVSNCISSLLEFSSLFSFRVPVYLASWRVGSFGVPLYDCGPGRPESRMYMIDILSNCISSLIVFSIVSLHVPVFSTRDSYKYLYTHFIL